MVKIQTVISEKNKKKGYREQFDRTLRYEENTEEDFASVVFADSKEGCSTILYDLSYVKRW